MSCEILWGICIVNLVSLHTPSRPGSALHQWIKKISSEDTALVANTRSDPAPKTRTQYRVEFALWPHHASNEEHSRGNNVWFTTTTALPTKRRPLNLSERKWRHDQNPATEVFNTIFTTTMPFSTILTGHTYSSFPSVMFYIVQVAILAFFCPPDAHFHGN